MRHALGLDGQTQAPHPTDHAPAPAQMTDRLSLHRPPRRFVKDGEVQVTTVRRSHPTEMAGGLGPAAHTQLEAARQTIRSQAITVERAERALADAQTAIRDLRTKLAHERMAREEVLQQLRRVEAERDAVMAERQTMREELAVERVGRERLEQDLRRAQEARAAAKRPTVDGMPRRRGRPPKVRPPETDMPTVMPPQAAEGIVTDTAVAPVLPRKRGRPRKVIVEGAEPPAPRKRGRPRKVVAEGTEAVAAPRPRGRPRKVPLADQQELGLGLEQAPRRRGRPPKVREPKPVKWWAKGWKAS